MALENSSFKDDYTITVKKGQQFVLTFESNPTTGYVWLAIFDSDIIKLISQKYELPPLMNSDK
jgi:predicted secreted protein